MYISRLPLVLNPIQWVILYWTQYSWFRGFTIPQVGFIPSDSGAHLCWLNDEALLIGWDQDRLTRTVAT